MSLPGSFLSSSHIPQEPSSFLILFLSTLDWFLISANSTKVLTYVELDSMHVGGQSSLADYCTYYVAYSDGSCTDVNSARAPDRMLGEVRGSNSRCMASTLVRTGFVRGSMTQGNGCYQHRCTNNSLEVSTTPFFLSLSVVSFFSRVTIHDLKPTKPC
jgi:hypothetical protein